MQIDSGPPINVGFLNRVAEKIHDSPTITKTIAVAIIILGAASIATLPISLPVLAGGAIAIAVIGGLIAVITSVALFALKMTINPHSMTNHAYKEVKKGVYPEGYLTYCGHVPMLTITADNDTKAGWIQGYLLGKQIHELRTRFNRFGVLQKPESIPHILEKLKRLLDKRFLDEMEGLAKGFNQWAKEKSSRIKQITLDEVLALHLLPDSIHFRFNMAEAQCSRNVRIASQSNQPVPVGCTTVLDVDKEDGIIFGRNMDWMSAGLSGTYSLLIRRQTPDGMKTVDVTVPGMIGSITAMNSEGLCMAMNVCTGCTADVEGIPAIFYNRKIIENCKNVAAVQNFTAKERPLGSYHLTVADKENNSHFFHFFQDQPIESDTYPRWVTNETVTNPWFFNSQERGRLLRHYFQNHQLSAKYTTEQRVRESLKLPFVNNAITTHSVIMRPKLGYMSVAFDNSFAAGVPLRSVLNQELFSEF